ncbi:MAG: hypothetical protein J0H78_16270 [Rhizobiales bacterium]|nr:hypothetical protein [Hyphomicrobiales bacterium]
MPDETITNNQHWLALSSAFSSLRRDDQADPLGAEMRLKAVIRTGQVVLRWVDGKSAEDRPIHTHLVRTKLRFQQTGLAFSGQEADWDTDLARYRPLYLLKSSFEEVARALPNIPFNDDGTRSSRMTLVEAVEWVRQTTNCTEEAAIISLKNEIHSGNISLVGFGAEPPIHRSPIIKQHGRLTFQRTRSYHPIQPSTLKKLDISLYGPGFLVPAGRRSTHENIAASSFSQSADNDDDALDVEERTDYQTLAFVSTKEVAQIWPHSVAVKLTKPIEPMRRRRAGRPGVRDEIFRALDEISRKIEVANLDNKRLEVLVLEHLGKSSNSRNYSSRTIAKYIGEWRETHKVGTK